MTPESPQTAQDFALMAFHGAPIALVMTERRVIRSCNLTFARLLGYRIDDLIGQSFKINNPNAVASCGCGTSFSI